MNTYTLRLARHKLTGTNEERGNCSILVDLLEIGEWRELQELDDADPLLMLEAPELVPRLILEIDTDGFDVTVELSTEFGRLIFSNYGTHPSLEDGVHELRRRALEEHESRFHRFSLWASRVLPGREPIPAPPLQWEEAGSDQFVAQGGVYILGYPSSLTLCFPCVFGERAETWLSRALSAVRLRADWSD